MLPNHSTMKKSKFPLSLLASLAELDEEIKKSDDISGKLEELHKVKKNFENSSYFDEFSAVVDEVEIFNKFKEEIFNFNTTTFSKYINFSNICHKPVKRIENKADKLDFDEIDTFFYSFIKKLYLYCIQNYVFLIQNFPQDETLNSNEIKINSQKKLITFEMSIYARKKFFQYEDKKFPSSEISLYIPSEWESYQCIILACIVIINLTQDENEKKIVKAKQEQVFSMLITNSNRINNEDDLVREAFIVISSFLKNQTSINFHKISMEILKKKSKEFACNSLVEVLNVIESISKFSEEHRLEMNYKLIFDHMKIILSKLNDIELKSPPKLLLIISEIKKFIEEQRTRLFEQQEILKKLSQKKQHNENKNAVKSRKRNPIKIQFVKKEVTNEEINKANEIAQQLIEEEEKNGNKTKKNKLKKRRRRKKNKKENQSLSENNSSINLSSSLTNNDKKEIDSRQVIKVPSSARTAQRQSYSTEYKNDRIIAYRQKEELEKKLKSNSLTTTINFNFTNYLCMDLLRSSELPSLNEICAWYFFRNPKAIPTKENPRLPEYPQMRKNKNASANNSEEPDNYEEPSSVNNSSVRELGKGV